MIVSMGLRLPHAGAYRLSKHLLEHAEDAPPEEHDLEPEEIHFGDVK